MNGQKKNALGEIVIVGFALFSMFFGAGNVIFPPFLGMEAGSRWLEGFSAYFIADIGLAMMGMFALLRVGSSEQVKMRLITHNNPSQLTVLLPTLEPGDYQLTITSQFTSGNKMLKEPRSYTFAPFLTVEGEPEPEGPDII